MPHARIRTTLRIKQAAPAIRMSEVHYVFELKFDNTFSVLESDAQRCG